MEQPQRAARQRQIAAERHVADHSDAALEIEQRVSFLAGYLRESGLSAYVLGISGGVDSSTAGRLAQLAVERLRASQYDARFIAMRLSHGVQHDEHDAQQSLAFIRPHETLTVDIRPAADAMLASLHASGLSFADASQQDFVYGNIKARERMIAQYAAASVRRGIVFGTDHAAESVMGFFTKFGDGGADVLPLAGLTKRRVRLLATARRKRRARSQGADRRPRNVAPPTARRGRLRHRLRRHRRFIFSKANPSAKRCSTPSCAFTTARVTSARCPTRHSIRYPLDCRAVRVTGAVAAAIRRRRTAPHSPAMRRRPVACR
jgi:NAD+ synthase